MKKSTFVALILAFGTGLLPAQIQNVLFPTENAYWQIQLGCIEPYGRDTYFCEDSTLDGKTYTHLYTIFSFPGGESSGSRGWLRRQDQRVYYRKDLDAPEFLVYDFDLQTNDTVRLMRNVIDFSDTSKVLTDLLFKVENVDSVLLPAGWRKRWRLQCQNYFLPKEIWIAGMGATFGPVDRFTCDILGGIAKVQCFWHNGQVAYTQFPQTTCNIQYPPECLVTVGASQPEDASFQASLSPNPFFDQLTVSFKDEVPRGIHLTLFDPAGREYAIQYRLINNTLQIDRGQLPPGIYFLKIENSDLRGRPVVWKVVAE